MNEWPAGYAATPISGSGEPSASMAWISESASEKLPGLLGVPTDDKDAADVGSGKWCRERRLDVPVHRWISAAMCGTTSMPRCASSVAYLRAESIPFAGDAVMVTVAPSGRKSI